MILPSPTIVGNGLTSQVDRFQGVRPTGTAAVASATVRGVRNFDPAALTEYRHRRGLSLDQLGERIGRARPNLITWEKGRSAPSPPKLVALAEALGVSPWQLTTIDPRSAELADFASR